MEMNTSLKHVAFIMDGNGRWAKARGLPRFLGHKAGCDRVIDIYEECRNQNIQVMSLYAFSTENWNRPQAEIKHLFHYLEVFFKKEIDRLFNEGCRIIVSGDISLLPQSTQETVTKALEKTKDCHDFIFNICLNYGGKAEIIRACKLFAEDVQNHQVGLEDLDEKLFENYLYTKNLPPVDLLIRTSGELRTSNFLPWQIAYAEFLFPKTPWPDFTKEEFRSCIKEYEKRSRRFGGLGCEKD